jgi:hypothetical protein
MLGKSASTKKVEVQAKVEKKRVWSSLNLDLDLSLSQKLGPCWTAFLSFLRANRRSSRTSYLLSLTGVKIVFPQPAKE